MNKFHISNFQEILYPLYNLYYNYSREPHDRSLVTRNRRCYTIAVMASMYEDRSIIVK